MTRSDKKANLPMRRKQVVPGARTKNRVQMSLSVCRNRSFIDLTVIVISGRGLSSAPKRRFEKKFRKFSVEGLDDRRVYGIASAARARLLPEAATV
jgi:hypothetical protein